MLVFFDDTLVMLKPSIFTSALTSMTYWWCLNHKQSWVLSPQWHTGDVETSIIYKCCQLNDTLVMLKTSTLARALTSMTHWWCWNNQHLRLRSHQWHTGDVETLNIYECSHLNDTLVMLKPVTFMSALNSMSNWWCWNHQH